jgi:glutamate-5-semialdehyde dehydrogenase
MIEQIRSVAALPDPLGRVLEATELDDQDPPPRSLEHSLEHSKELPRPGLHLEKISVPLGVLAVIFEARPDAVTQIAALAIKSGNAVLLKPGREVEQTSRTLVDVLRAAIQQEGLPPASIALVLGRERVAELLAMHDLVAMVIPRGSKSLVEYVQANTRIPVLGHAEGICHIYIDRAAAPQLALRIIEDAKLDYPAACNSVETVLVHREIAPQFVPVLLKHLRERGVTVHADVASRQIAGANEPLPEVADWHTEYGAPELAVGVVDSLDAAIQHIHRHGSLHTESIVTEDQAAAARFLREVDAAGVFHNASTRFADGFRYGFGAEVGISTSKLHARGPVGLDGLTTYKYILRGRGHIAADYRGANARAFTHRRGPGKQAER